MTFGEAVSKLLEERHMTKAELARRMGTKRLTVGNIINDSGRIPLFKTAFLVARALDVSMQELADMVYGDDD